MKVGGIELLDEIPEVGEVPESHAEDKFNYAEDLEKLKYREKLNAVLKIEHELIEAKTMLTQRQVYAALLLALSVIWLGFIGKFMWHFGEVTVPPQRLDIPQVRPVSDSVLIALITTTTINVLGLFYVVARWLFPDKSASAKEAISRLKKVKEEE